MFRRLLSPRPVSVAPRAGLIADMLIARASRLFGVLRSRRAQQRVPGVGRAVFSFNRRAVKHFYSRERKRQQDRQARLPAVAARGDRPWLYSRRRRSRWASQLIRSRQFKLLSSWKRVRTGTMTLPARRYFFRKKALFIGRAPKHARRRFMPPRGRRRRGLMTRRLVSMRKHRRLFVKWRRAVLRRFLSRPPGRRRERFVRLDVRAAFSRGGFPANTAPRTLVRAPRAAGGRVFRWLRGRLSYRREGKNRSWLRVYTSKSSTVRTLRSSRQLLTAAGTCSAGRRNTLLVRAAALLDARHPHSEGTTAAVPAFVSRSAGLVVMRRARRQLEKRTYRHQLKLRLPCTAVKRRGLRQAGRTLFAQNTLTVPTNWFGARKRLLAPKTT